MSRGFVLKNEVCERTQRLASFTPFQTNFKISLMKYSISLHHKHKHVQFVRCYAKMAVYATSGAAHRKSEQK